eukprot:11652706-Alexandrium_andersonii.AAC.1
MGGLRGGAVWVACSAQLAKRTARTAPDGRHRRSGKMRRMSVSACLARCTSNTALPELPG